VLRSALSSRFPCLWPSPPHRARPLPTPPALYFLLLGAYSIPPPARGRTTMASGHRRVGVALRPCVGTLTTSPTLPLSGGGSFPEPSSSKAGFMRLRRPLIAITLPRSLLPLPLSRKPWPRPSGEASSCGASPRRPHANGDGLTGLDCMSSASTLRAFSSSRLGRRKTQPGRLKKG
jgi:hypothetical protein